MSTPEQPATPALTRKQLRDIRNTGATPIITDVPGAEPTPASDAAPDSRSDADHAEQAESESAPAAESAPVEPSPTPAVAAPLPRAAAPAAMHELPGADASVDLGVAPLTRRQARQQERIRTASVPVITPDVAAAHAATHDSAVESDTPPEGQESEHDADALGSGDTDTEHDAHDAGSESAYEFDDSSAHADESEGHDAGTADADETPDADQEHRASEEHVADDTTAEHSVDADDVAHDDEPMEEPEEERAIVHPEFGSELLAGGVVSAELPPSFDQLISRSATGSIGTGNALILSQTPSAPPLVAPVAATGEVLITGTFNLPEGLGSTGHAPGTADGKDVDAVLVDGELPAHSSPTPIAASAAISTVKNGGDIIKPPTPEKGGRLMLTLAITAGVLALALVGVLILAFVTGVF